MLVSGECEFPSDNPIQDLMQDADQVQAQVIGNRRTYVYTDVFGSDCVGCVRTLNFCYQTGDAESEELMTIEIRGPGQSGVRGSYTVMVNSMKDRANCPQNYNLGHDFCCVEQNLSESLKVENQHNFYALKIPNTQSMLLRSTQMVNGHWIDHNGNETQGSVYKPLFYFVIDPVVNPSEGKSPVMIIIHHYFSLLRWLLKHPNSL